MESSNENKTQTNENKTNTTEDKTELSNSKPEEIDLKKLITKIDNRIKTKVRNIWLIIYIRF